MLVKFQLEDRLSESRRNPVLISITNGSNGHKLYQRSDTGTSTLFTT